MRLYAIAALIVRAVENLLQRSFATVSLPVFSEIVRSKPTRLREIYYKLRLPADLAALFLIGLLFSIAPLVIRLLYDARYSGAGDMLQILVFSLFATRYGVAHQLYVGLGAPRNLAVLQVVAVASLYTAVPMLYQLVGMRGALWAIALHALATLPFIYHFNAKLGLIDLRRELQVLPALPLGYLIGQMFKSVSKFVE